MLSQYYTTPQRVFFVTGSGCHTEQLAAFELALRDAGIHKYNLITVSSIFPAQCQIVTPDVGLSSLSGMDGALVPCVLARCEVNEPHRVSSAAIGLAYPSDHTHYGYLSEVHEPGMNAKEAEEYAEDLAIWMLLTTLGVIIEEKDLDKAWNQRKEIWRVQGKEYESNSWSISKPCPKDKWVATVAAAILLP